MPADMRAMLHRKDESDGDGGEGAGGGSGEREHGAGDRGFLSGQDGLVEMREREKV